jgi:LysM repeat protein
MHGLFYRLTALLALAALAGGGCTSLRGMQSTRQTREMSESMLMQEQVRQISGRLENIQSQIDQLWSEIDQVRSASRKDSQAVADNLDSRVQELTQQLARIDSARAADKQEIIDKMSSSIGKMMAASAPRPSSGRNISQYGVEHTVQAGQTLSEIAAAYGVKVSVLIEANSISNPNALKVGQKLFIPE